MLIENCWLIDVKCYCLRSWFNCGHSTTMWFTASRIWQWHNCDNDTSADAHDGIASCDFQCNEQPSALSMHCLSDTVIGRWKVTPISSAYHGDGVWLEQLRGRKNGEVSDVGEHIDDGDQRHWDPDCTRQVAGTTNATTTKKKKHTQSTALEITTYARGIFSTEISQNSPTKWFISHGSVSRTILHSNTKQDQQL